MTMVRLLYQTLSERRDSNPESSVPKTEMLAVTPRSEWAYRTILFYKMTFFSHSMRAWRVFTFKNTHRTWN